MNQAERTIPRGASRVQDAAFRFVEVTERENRSLLREKHRLGLVLAFFSGAFVMFVVFRIGMMIWP